eukprot:CAMPEP_0170479486 /NCGR_PEP_ID=MMETSP0208-20121228/706_1 /TAXON_ID=197538 /ORGANISM="Strombidium inclinatum, Strain S3" /LENGTH=163 /DNA_ID=CAMNT_0010751889 /DNA_START=1 /DNA_END=492 /DNA_ORIENTATION=+
MISRFAATQRTQAMARMFSSYNYRSATNPRVWMTLARGGSTVGKLEIELFAQHQPSLSANFQALCKTDAPRNYVGSAFKTGLQGHGVQGGAIVGDDSNQGADCMRLPDENLELRHHKRGMVTMTNDGIHSNGSEFMVTFDQAHHLDGYNNVVGEIVGGDYVLS